MSNQDRIRELEAKSKQEMTVKERLELAQLKRLENSKVGLPKVRPGKNR